MADTDAIEAVIFDAIRTSGGSERMLVLRELFTNGDEKFGITFKRMHSEEHAGEDFTPLRILVQERDVDAVELVLDLVPSMKNGQVLAANFDHPMPLFDCIRDDDVGMVDVLFRNGLVTNLFCGGENSSDPDNIIQVCADNQFIKSVQEGSVKLEEKIKQPIETLFGIIPAGETGSTVMKLIKEGRQSLIKSKPKLERLAHLVCADTELYPELFSIST